MRIQPSEEVVLSLGFDKITIKYRIDLCGHAKIFLSFFDIRPKHIGFYRKKRWEFLYKIDRYFQTSDIVFL